ncbi:putative Ig domain-containing protein, partial [Vibrio campbellii]
LVSDGSLTAKSEVNLNVALAMTPVDPDLINHAPVWEVVKLPTAVVGDEYHFQIKATDQDGDEINYSIQNAPSWLSIDSKTGWIDGVVTEESLGDVELEVSASDDGLSAVQSVVLSTEGKLLETDISGKFDAVFETPMALPLAQALNGTVESEVKLDIPTAFKLRDVQFVNEGGFWYLVNNTPMPVADVSVSHDGIEHLALLQLDKEIPGYTKAKLAFTDEPVTGLKYVNLRNMFEPKVILGTNQNPCSDKSVTCFNSPKVGGERETYERLIGYSHDIFNRVSFIDAVEAFFENQCNTYSECKGYTAANPDGLSYARRTYLLAGQPGHRLTMEVMRNVYEAEGTGVGTNPDLSMMTSPGEGYATIWEEYVDVDHGSYRPLPINTLFHETMHAHGFSHSSGWTYGMADHLKWEYIPSLGVDVYQIPSLTSADTLVDYEIIGKGLIRLTLQSKAERTDIANMKFRFSSNSELSLTVKHMNVSGKNTIDIQFNGTPKTPVHLQVWDSESTYVTTLRFDNLKLAPPMVYEIYGKRYLVLMPDSLDKNADGWGVRNICKKNGGTTELAVRLDYGALYDYLYARNRLNELPFKKFLTFDEPKSYHIYEMHFGDDELTDNHFSIYNKLGEDRGIVCMEYSL